MSKQPHEDLTDDFALRQFVDDSTSVINAEDQLTDGIAHLLEDPYDGAASQNLVTLLSSDTYKKAQSAAQRLNVREIGGLA